MGVDVKLKGTRNEGAVVQPAKRERTLYGSDAYSTPLPQPITRHDHEKPAFLSDEMPRKWDSDLSNPQPPSKAAPEALPKKVGGYEIIDKMGSGGMGEVFSAKEISSGWTVALKAIREAAVSHGREEWDQNLVLEAQIGGRLSHPNIVPVRSIIKGDGKHWMVMPFIAGSTLRESARSANKNFADAKAFGTYQTRLADVVLEFCEAVIYLHEAGVIHRDLKLDNVIVSSEMQINEDGKPVMVTGHAKLADLGLARPINGDTINLPLSDNDPDSELKFPPLKENTASGTLGYMAPEQLCADKLDARTDVYALGVNLYELLTGEHPYGKKQGQYPLDTYQAILHDPIKPLPPGRSAGDQAVFRVACKALQKDPKDRHQSVREFSDDLKAALETKEPSFFAKARSWFAGVASAVSRRFNFGRSRPGEFGTDMDLPSLPIETPNGHFTMGRARADKRTQADLRSGERTNLEVAVKD